MSSSIILNNALVAALSDFSLLSKYDKNWFPVFSRYLDTIKDVNSKPVGLLVLLLKWTGIPDLDVQRVINILLSDFKATFNAVLANRKIDWNTLEPDYTMDVMLNKFAKLDTLELHKLNVNPPLDIFNLSKSASTSKPVPVSNNQTPLGITDVFLLKQVGQPQPMQKPPENAINNLQLKHKHRHKHKHRKNKNKMVHKSNSSEPFFSSSSSSSSSKSARSPSNNSSTSSESDHRRGEKKKHKRPKEKHKHHGHKHCSLRQRSTHHTNRDHTIPKAW